MNNNTDGKQQQSQREEATSQTGRNITNAKYSSSGLSVYRFLTETGLPHQISSNNGKDVWTGSSVADMAERFLVVDEALLCQ